VRRARSAGNAAGPVRAVRRVLPQGAPDAGVPAATPHCRRTEQGPAHNVPLAYLGSLVRCFQQPAAAPGRSAVPRLPEPLTEREREILKLLAAGKPAPVNSNCSPSTTRGLPRGSPLSISSLYQHAHSLLHLNRRERPSPGRMAAGSGGVQDDHTGARSCRADSRPGSWASGRTAGSRPGPGACGRAAPERRLGAQRQRYPGLAAP
jgi:hypothetical protein